MELVLHLHMVVYIPRKVILTSIASIVSVRETVLVAVVIVCKIIVIKMVATLKHDKTYVLNSGRCTKGRRPKFLPFFDLEVVGVGGGGGFAMAPVILHGFDII